MLRPLRIISLFMLVGAAALAGCSRSDALPDDARTRKVNEQVRARWGKSISELPVDTLVAVSAHNENILQEYAWAFNLHYAIERGRRVEIVWRDVGGGGSAIQRTLQNVYDKADTSGIDVVWGGGDLLFSALCKPIGAHAGGVLEYVELPADVFENDNIPADLRGQAMYDKPIDADRPGWKKVRWIGSAVSGFGFLYNAGMLRRCNIAPPTQWGDLADSRFTGLLELADPAQSGSVTQTYLTIVRSEFTREGLSDDDAWRAGWARLLDVLSNAKLIADSAGAAANAPVLGDAPVATTIDFYGLMRVAEAPSELVYVSPAGQTSFGPDPIGVLKGAPHRELAEEFMRFVMSVRGQAIWALPVGAEDGPVRTNLGRLPIRRDVYELYRGKLIPNTANPYEVSSAMPLDKRMLKVNFGVLRRLIVASAVDNLDAIRGARRRLNELAGDPSRQGEYQRRLAEFHRLPDELSTLAGTNDRAVSPKDARAMYEMNMRWRDFFAAKYAEAAR